jgi:hypothetical protein
MLNPNITNNPGFWFSFSNSLALVYYFNNNNADINLSSDQNKIISLYKTSLICFFASTPITLIFFQKIQFAGIISNVIAVPYFIFILFPITIFAFLINNEFITTFAILTHKALIIFANIINKIPYMTFEILLIDKVEISLLIITCILIIKNKLHNYLIALLIVIITASDTVKINQDVIILNSIPRSITLKIKEDSIPILTGSIFNSKFNCNEKNCVINHQNNKFYIIKNTVSYKNFLGYCSNYNLIINLSSNNFSCYQTPTITALDLYFNKRILIFLKDGKYDLIYP